jgi:hypothetical protein
LNDFNYANDYVKINELLENYIHILFLGPMATKRNGLSETRDQFKCTFHEAKVERILLYKYVELNRNKFLCKFAD